ncbi:hypothetical protein TRFO_33566 [Tritrichomonas foetus]|uniref:Uncharacterized protein n=1 Tax=Tritrichomonas foetus TaxID=1144522 RepID=A0A1J4JLG2_9EUKA|nr:hypothetical protein TRFO_33566 [Tritrichomonas foetus]|eukprot:OHS99922.1 hypothetical protein TRFO_33566 [Tritrichomonas foetus]
MLNGRPIQITWISIYRNNFFIKYGQIIIEKVINHYLENMINEKAIINQFNTIFHQENMANNLQECVEKVNDWVKKEKGMAEINRKIEEVKNVKLELENEVNSLSESNPVVCREIKEIIKSHEKTQTESSVFPNEVFEVISEDETDKKLCFHRKKLSFLRIVKRILLFVFLFRVLYSLYSMGMMYYDFHYNYQSED